LDEQLGRTASLSSSAKRLLGGPSLGRASSGARTVYKLSSMIPSNRLPLRNASDFFAKTAMRFSGQLLHKKSVYSTEELFNMK
jgi:hypothetical protein